jgi:hypothetical protein
MSRGGRSDQQGRTAVALKHLIQIRMNALDEVEDAGDEVYAHDVEPHAPDESGCNWNMDSYRGPTEYASAVRLLVNRLRREYRLIEGESDHAGDSP